VSAAAEVLGLVGSRAACSILRPWADDPPSSRSLWSPSDDRSRVPAGVAAALAGSSTGWPVAAVTPPATEALVTGPLLSDC